MSLPRKLVFFTAIGLGSVVAVGCVEPRHRWDRYAERDDRRCARIVDRIDFDRDKIREIEPTGRHRDALRWYRDDLEDARRDLDRCRYAG